MRRFIYVLAVVALSVSLVPVAAFADHEEDGIYELPALDLWTKNQLTVYIVPPSHGQIYNEFGPLGGGDPNEVTPFQNSYLRAIEDSIKEWNNGIRMFGSAKLQRFKAHVYVLGRDEIPGQSSPDILVVTDENKGPVLGFAFRSKPCIVNNSQMFTRSFSYADMYNVMGQEYGHCLGLQHIGSQGGIEPTSAQKHPVHDVMNGFYADGVGRADTHLHCVSNLDVKALEYTFVKTLTGSNDSRPIYMRVEKYRTTCGGDGRPVPKDARRAA